MRKYFFKGVLFSIFWISCNSHKKLNNNDSFDIRDSTQVKNYIKHSSLCMKLKYVETHKNYFINYVGFSNLIISDINQKEKTNFYIFTITGNKQTSSEQREQQIQEYVDFIKNKNCKSNHQ